MGASIMIAFTSQKAMVSQSDDDCLTSLPEGFLPFEEFQKEFTLGAVSTEQLNPITKTLSQVVHKDILEGLGLLLNAEEKVIEGFKLFIPSIRAIAPQIATRIGKEGRVFLIGSGSSGRVAVDIAAKCSLVFPECAHQIRGIIAGGDSALIRAREGFEDSKEDGMRVLETCDLNSKDTVILISASGSSSFNVGCGHFSANRGGQCVLFL